MARARDGGAPKPPSLRGAATALACSNSRAQIRLRAAPRRGGCSWCWCWYQSNTRASTTNRCPARFIGQCFRAAKAATPRERQVTYLPAGMWLFSWVWDMLGSLGALRRTPHFAPRTPHFARAAPSGRPGAAPRGATVSKQTKTSLFQLCVLSKIGQRAALPWPEGGLKPPPGAARARSPRPLRTPPPLPRARACNRGPARGGSSPHHPGSPQRRAPHPPFARPRAQERQDPVPGSGQRRQNHAAAPPQG